MANKPEFKDRRRDPNPSNPLPPAQRREQKVKGKKPTDKPARQPVRKPTKKTAQPTAKVGDFPTTEKTPRVRKAGKGLNPLLRVTDTESGTIHEEAGRLELRKGKTTSPHEVVKVEGNPLEVVARPEVLHPVELLPHLRDTVVKDQLRDADKDELTAKADARVDTTPPNWRDHTVDLEKGSPQGKVATAPPIKKKGDR